MMNKKLKSFLFGIVLGVPIAMIASCQSEQPEESKAIDCEKYIVEQDVETEVFGVDPETDFEPGFYTFENCEPYPDATKLEIEATAYCYGEVTASGKKVREGMAAMAKEYMGKTAIVYSADHELIGIYEVEDTGGDYRIKNGQCIDIYIPDYESCINFGRQDVIVYLLEAKG